MTTQISPEGPLDYRDHDDTPQTAYDAMGATPKMLISGGYALAFQKVFLERNERWRPLLLGPAAQGSISTNIQ